ncbi:Aspartate carbamoyltransferase [Nymphon striatum]|nr:Aspartate carbamoyltransferase [Nymphon striatum]
MVRNLEKVKKRNSKLLNSIKISKELLRVTPLSLEKKRNVILSADVINFSAGQSSVKKGETLIDTVNNILSMKVDMVVMRHPNPGAGIFLSKHVNAFHCAHVKVCGPKTLLPKHIESLGVEVETDLRKALNWCDVANMLRIQNERLDISYFPTTREYTQQFGVNKKLLDSLDKEIVIMHPGPINRGVEITSDVADSKQSIILNQVENGVAIRMADDVLEFLELSKSHKATNKSFVVVTDKVAYDEVPEEIVVVPTLQEARDIIEMEEIERDLGI